MLSPPSWHGRVCFAQASKDASKVTNPTASSCLRGRSGPYACAWAGLGGIGGCWIASCRRQRCAVQKRAETDASSSSMGMSQARSPFTTWAIAGLFLSFIAVDVSLGASALMPVDFAVHDWVRAHTSAEQRDNFNSLSDVLDNGAQVAGWVAAFALAVQQRNIAAISMPLGLESVKTIYRALKPGLHRVRPSEILTDFSFPSAHTARFCFCITLVACVIGPRLIRGDKQQEQHSGGIASAQWFVVFLVAWLTMGSTRVLADAHWSSDTAGGAALGVGVAAAIETLLIAWAVFNDPTQQKRDLGK